MAVPLVISFTLRFTFSLVDLVYARFLGDPSAIAAIAFYLPFQGVYTAVWVGLSAGFTASLSNAFGHRDEARIVALSRAMQHLLWWLVPLFALGGVVVWSLVPHLGLADDLEDSFLIYGTTMLVGMPLTGFWSIHPDSVVKAHHDTRSTMLAGILAGVSNVLLNTLFVFGFGLGLFGIALATVLSRLPALAYALHRARRLEAARLVEPGRATVRSTALDRPWPPAFRTILVLALPASVTYALTAAESSLVTALLALLPDETTALASFGVYHQLLMLALMPTVATSVAVLPFVARSIPEGHHAHVSADLRRVAWLVAGLGLLFTVPAGLLFPAELAAFFVPGQAEQALASQRTRDVLRLLPIAALASLPFLLLRPVFEALHEPRRGVSVSALRFLLLSFPLVLLGRALSPSLGLDPLLGIVLGLIAAAALTSLLTIRLVCGSLRRAAVR